MKWLWEASLVAVFTAFFGSASSAHGSVRHLNDLSISDHLKLDESQLRTVKYDRALQLVEKLRSNHRISRQEYEFQERELLSFIGAEASYQNDLLIHRSTFPEDAREVMENVAKYSIEIPAYIAGIVLQGLAKSSYSYSMK